MTCDYNYTIPQGEVTGFTYDSASSELVITGTNLPANYSLLRGVNFAKSGCLVTANSATSITCTLMHTETCGNHVPYVTANLGLVNNSASLQPLNIGCNIASVVPTTQLNLLG
jgi:hypothetical protein